MIGVLVVASAAALFAGAFRASLSWVTRTLLHGDDIVDAMQELPMWARACLPALGGLLAGLVGMRVSRASGHGVGDVMEAVVLGRVRLSMRVTLLKSLSSWFAIASGGSLGREGPLIQFGGAFGKVVGKALRVDSPRVRMLIAVGTAAGFAAAYNTPLAAVLFVIEVVSGFAVLDVIVPTLIGTAVATAITRVAVGPGPIYGAREFAMHSPNELIAFAVLGVLGGVAAQAFMRLLTFGEDWFRRPGLPLPWRPAVGGAIAGGFVALIPAVAGNGYEPLNALLDGRFAVGFVAWLLLAKCIATTASVSSGSPGGVFTPTLLLGGGVGLLFGEAMHATFGPSVGPPGGYALVGMAATTAATTHAPLMAAVMAFELSGDYAVVLPLIVATAIATFVSRRLRPDSIYTAELRARGVGWELTLEGRKPTGSRPPVDGEAQ